MGNSGYKKCCSHFSTFSSFENILKVQDSFENLWINSVLWTFFHMCILCHRYNSNSGHPFLITILNYSFVTPQPIIKCNNIWMKNWFIQNFQNRLCIANSLNDRMFFNWMILLLHKFNCLKTNPWALVFHISWSKSSAVTC